MLYVQIIIIALLSIYISLDIILSVKYSIPIKYHLILATTGIALIFLLKILQGYTGLNIPVNLVTLSFGAFGPIGVLFYILISFLFL